MIARKITMTAPRNGFSLVELSIVLVILGLLTGGILGGQELIRAAELRSVTKDMNKFQTAINTFRDKYMMLPGDMNNAVQFWGAQAGGTATGTDPACTNLDRSNPATGKPTCNGNGNGRIGAFLNMTSSSAFESYRAWQHLANAGLIEGTYTGVTDSTINNYTSGPGITPGWNVPASAINNAGFNLVYWGNITSASSVVTSNIVIEGNYGHVFVFGRGGAGWYHNMGYGQVLPPEEAWNIDMKVDDGKPGTGVVMSPGTSTNGGCASSNTPAAEYELATTNAACGLIIKTGF
jgi:prepilin-type N-terminal cleavage/methylation domain-containing protein